MHSAQPPFLTRWFPFTVRIALMFSAMFFITGITTPFLPVWFASRGFSVGEIALLSIVPQLVRSFAAPAVGFEADRSQAHRALVIVVTAVGMAAWLLMSATTGFVFALAAMALVAISNTAAPLVETIAMAGVKVLGHDYGRMRLWGSAAFVAANLLAGWLAGLFGPQALIALIVAGAVMSFAVSLLIPPVSVADLSPRRRLTLADARELLKMREMQLVLLSAGAVQGAHGMFYAYGTLHWQAQGYSPQWFGTLWAIGLVTEIALFFWSSDAVRRIGAAELMVMGPALSVFRWILMAFDPSLVVLVPLQILHGLTFGTSHIGAMHMLAKIAPADRAATAQALYAVVQTLGVVIATAISARLYPLAGGQTYLAMAVMAAIALAAAVVIKRTVRQQYEMA
jgi:MFS transporter, PPP family, 3-phenylpropionic acid transporter